MNILTRSIVRHAHAIARESSARAVLLSADVIQEEQDLAGLIEDVGYRVLLVEQNVYSALSVASKAYVLETGKVVAHDRSEDLLGNEDVLRAYLGG